MFFLNKKQQTQNKIIEIQNAVSHYKNLNISFILKDTYNSIIPLNLYTCWHTKDLPPLLKNTYEILMKENPEFNHYLYDENDCIDFIRNHFDIEVLNAYHSLIPCSYKSDLWRYCVLYINGGIYYDIKFRCINGFKFIHLLDKE